MFLSINFLEGRFEGRKGREKQEKHGAIPYEKWMSQGVQLMVILFEVHTHEGREVIVV